VFLIFLPLDDVDGVSALEVAEVGSCVFVDEQVVRIVPIAARPRSVVYLLPVRLVVDRPFAVGLSEIAGESFAEAVEEIAMQLGGELNVVVAEDERIVVGGENDDLVLPLNDLKIEGVFSVLELG
jgi:hypothetical protein